MTPAADLPRALLVHRTDSRVRLRLPSRRRDPRFLERVERELAAHRAVESVRADPLTGSVLIHYHGELEPIMQHGRERELFELERPRWRTPAEHVQAGAARIDGWLRSMSDGRLDLDNLVVLGLFGLGVMQFARGQILPAGFALVWQAAGIARGVGTRSGADIAPDASG